MLRERFSATRVILFGSLARGRFRLDSDIDLAVAGLAKGDLFRAMAGALEFTNRWVDIKPLEEVDPHFVYVFWRRESTYDEQYLARQTDRDRR
ncbi:MAG: nucleotidyltransferase domain-containing protein [Caldilineaceae bacterium]